MRNLLWNTLILLLSLCCHHSLGNTYYSPLSLSLSRVAKSELVVQGYSSSNLFPPLVSKSVYILACIDIDPLDLIVMFAVAFVLHVFSMLVTITLYFNNVLCIYYLISFVFGNLDLSLLLSLWISEIVNLDYWALWWLECGV